MATTIGYVPSEAKGAEKSPKKEKATEQPSQK